MLKTVKKFQCISNLTILADLHGHLAPEESLNWKNQFPCFQKHSCRTSFLMTPIITRQSYHSNDLDPLSCPVDQLD